jgi:hypothetical protein
MIWPAHYILKWWTRKALCGTIKRNVVENPVLDTILAIGYSYTNLAIELLKLLSLKIVVFWWRMTLIPLSTMTMMHE